LTFLLECFISIETFYFYLDKKRKNKPLIEAGNNSYRGRKTSLSRRENKTNRDREFLSRQGVLIETGSSYRDRKNKTLIISRQEKTKLLSRQGVLIETGSSYRDRKNKTLIISRQEKTKLFSRQVLIEKEIVYAF
jgi:hypothetical protein